MDRVAVGLDRRAHGAEHAFGVIAGRPRLAYDGQPVGVHACHQDAALHLRAGDRQIVVHAAQPGRANAQRCIAPGLASHDIGPHAPEGLHDATHRPAADLGRAGQETGELLAGQQTGEQADGRARVGTVQHIGRLLQTVQSAAMHDQLGGRVNIDAHAQRAHHIDRGPAVGAVEKVVDLAHAIGNTRKHHRTMADRLVPRDVAAAGERGTGVES